MMITPYISPKKIIQVPLEPTDISWNTLATLDTTGDFTATTQSVRSIATSSGKTILSHVNQLWCTDFRFSKVGTSILGIEVRLITQRLARIQDYVIQLVYNDAIVGRNLANDEAENVQEYGGPFDTWGRPWTVDEIMSPSFGVVIGLGPNKTKPHNDVAYIDKVDMRIYFE